MSQSKIPNIYFKSLSPRPLNEASMSKSPKLPNIASTQRLSKKYFIPEPTPEIPESLNRNMLPILEVSQPTIPQTKKRNPQIADEISENTCKNESTTSLYEKSTIYKDNSSTYKLENELKLIKLQMKCSARKARFLEKMFRKCEKVLKGEETPKVSTELERKKSVNNGKSQRSSDDDELHEIEREEVEKIIELAALTKFELTTALDHLKKNEHAKEYVIKDFNDKHLKLSSENESLRRYVTDLQYKLEILVQNKALFSQEMAETKQKHQEQLISSDKVIETLKEQLTLSTTEAENLKELLNRIDAQKKRQNDSITKLETQITRLSNELIKTNHLYETTKLSYQKTLEQLGDIQSKVENYEIEKKNYENQANSLRNFELKYIEGQDELRKVNQNLENLKILYEVDKQKWHRKELAYKQAMQDLMVQLESENFNKEVYLAQIMKLKKMMHHRESD